MPGGSECHALASPRSAGRSSTAGVEPSRWLSQVELKTHVPREVPLWLCPQLTFHTYSADALSEEVNAELRSGGVPANRRRVAITRQERPEDGVQYNGTPVSDERLSRLFGGALDARVGEGEAVVGGSSVAAPQQQAQARPAAVRTPPFRPAPGGGSLSLAPAWGALGGTQHLGSSFEGSLEPLNGVTDGLEVVEEDWLKA